MNQKMSNKSSLGEEGESDGVRLEDTSMGDDEASEESDVGPSL